MVGKSAGSEAEVTTGRKGFGASQRVKSLEQVEAGSYGDQGWENRSRRRVKNLELCKKSPNKGYVVHRWEERRCWVLDSYFWQFAWLWHVSVLFGSFLCVALFLNCSNLVFLFCFVDGGSCVVVNNYVECLVLLMEIREWYLGLFKKLVPLHCICLLM
jgi:hypothetical protein